MENVLAMKRGDRDREAKLLTAGLFISNAIQVLEGLGLHGATEELCSAYREIKEEQEVKLESRNCKNIKNIKEDCPVARIWSGLRVG